MGSVIVRPKDVQAAAHRIRRIIRSTPLLSTPDGLLKLENFQHTGAYKVRGASNAVLSMLEKGIWKSVITASAGNHAAGLAWVAREAGLQAMAVVPFGTPQVKIDNCRSMGCLVVQAGNNVEESLDKARKMAHREGMHFVHPFDDPDVICGQGTIALELLKEDPDVIVVPIGGGGLAAGIGLTCAHKRTKIIGVQIEGMDVMRRRLHSLPGLDSLPTSIADGVSVADPGKLTERLCSHYLDDILVVTETEVIETVIRLASQHNIIVEGAGAVAAAALPKISAGKKIAVVTGGNIDLQLFSELIVSRKMQRVA